MSLREDIESFVETHSRLIALEREAEIRETTRLQATLPPRELERRGVCLLGLRLAGTAVGLGGRPLLHLEPPRGKELPSGRIGPGDVIALRGSGEADGSRGRGGRRRGSPGKASRRAGNGGGRSRSGREGSEPGLRGVVWRLQPARVTVALEGDPETVPDGPLRVDRVANDVTYRRLLENLEQLVRYRGGPADRLRRVLFGAAAPRFEGYGPEDLHDPGPELDASQREAVMLASGAHDVALIHGPPGTGKTTTLAEVIRQAVLRGERVLACAGTNVAVDNLVEKLVARDLDVVRTGHPARLLPSVLEHSLDRKVQASEGARVAADIRRELDRAYRELERAGGRKARHAARDEARRLRGELREIEDLAVRETLRKAQVVLATNIGAGDSLLRGTDFDLVAIDEAAQAVEAAAWIPLLKGRRAVLAGDDLQLPPTILSREAAREGLAITLFERLRSAHGESATRLLTTQYRMHERIMRWSSEALYEGRLEAHPSVREHLLRDLPGCGETPETLAPFVLIDTAGCGLEEEEEEDTVSKANPGEAEVVTRHLERLLAAGVPPSQVAVITPYSAQARDLRSRIRPRWPEVEIDSVDGFQGREKEAVIISLVRSNPRGDVGFLADDRRTNVAVTRARRHVAVIGDSATVCAHPFLERLVAYCGEHAEHQSAWDSRG